MLNKSIRQAMNQYINTLDFILVNKLKYCRTKSSCYNIIFNCKNFVMAAENISQQCCIKRFNKSCIYNFSIYTFFC